MLTIEAIFPPFGLRITSGTVEMRVLRDEDIPELVEFIQGGIQAADLPMPFLNDWHAQPFAPGRPMGSRPPRSHGGGASEPSSRRRTGTWL